MGKKPQNRRAKKYRKAALVEMAFTRVRDMPDAPNPEYKLRIIGLAERTREAMRAITPRQIRERQKQILNS